MAWLSDTLGGSPSGDFTQSAEPYLRVDGVKVAANWADLTDGTILHPIEADEQGGRPRSAGLEAIVEVWTSTEGDGTLSNNLTCNNWTSALDVLKGVSGNSTSSSEAGPGDAPWTSINKGNGKNCNLPLRLYCFEQ